MNGPFRIHWFPLISHDVAQLDLPSHQFVFLTHLRLRQWSCSRLCWCPACKEALVSGKWFAHWQWPLCWRSPAVFTLWWINPVDRDLFSLRHIANHFGYRCSHRVTTCLFQESISTIPFWNSKRPLPTRSSALCLHHAHPFVAAEDKNQSHAEKQRVWSRSCGLQDLLRNIQIYTVIVSKIWITGYWLCSQLGHVAAANQWTIVEIVPLATVVWKWGCQPFSRRCSLNVMHCRKERDLFDMFV